MTEATDDGLRYSDEHLWFRQDDAVVTAGVTEKIARILTLVTAVELPAVDARLSPRDEVAVIESQKATIVVEAPVGFRVLAVNEDVLKDPMLVRTDPYGRGWLLGVELESGGWDRLLDAAAYRLVTADVKEKR